jgi:two-component system LytT family sensor kinase
MAVLMHRQRDLDRVAAASSAAALRVAERALGLLGRGFGPETAGEMAAIVKEETGVGAVAVTDTERVLGFVGLGSDHHRAGSPVLSALTRQAIQDRAVVFADGVHQTFQCPVSAICPLHSALVVPLEVDGTVLGTVQLYEPMNRRFLHMNRLLGEGIGTLLSSQLVLAKYQEQKNLLVLSELRLLRAQVNPHFLFNSLNTIMAILRKDAGRGRELVGHLSAYFRKNLQRHGELSTLEEELEHIRAYVEIEKARFEGLRVEIDVPAAFRAVKVPTFTLQPLLENAIRHGVSRMPGPGTVRILAFAEAGTLRIDVEDDAGAYDESRRSREGLGLNIVEKRLRSLFGPAAGPEIHCEPGSLTRMTIRVPLGDGLVE